MESSHERWTKKRGQITIYNIRLEELNEERTSRESSDTRLEKALKMLPPINPEKLKPSPESLKQLKANILKDAQGEECLRIKVQSLKYADGFSFKGLRGACGMKSQFPCIPVIQ